MKEQKTQVKPPRADALRREPVIPVRKSASPVLANSENRPAAAEKRVVGRPFQPGEDSRRHMNGRKCADAIAFSQEFNRALAEGGDPRALAALIWKRAMKGQPYALDVILDRLLGPVTKALAVSTLPVLYSIRYEPDPEADAFLNVSPRAIQGRETTKG